MKKLGFFAAAIWALGLILLPQTSFAELVEMTDTDLSKVTGQAGFSLRADDIVKFDIQGENFTFGDPNGPNISLANTVMQGYVASNGGVDLDFVTDRTAEGTVIHGLSLTANDVTVAIDKFETDIKLGEGTLGTFGMYGFKAHISGNVRVYSRAN
jgi:hypothetical protein